MNALRKFEKIAVLGAGSWGTALANVAARAGHDVFLWGRDAARMRDIASTRENRPYLQGISIESAVSPVSDLECVQDVDAALLVVPAQAQRELASAIEPLIRRNAVAVICAKGIERGTHMFMGETVAQALPHTPLALLSGPSFAHDVAKGLPTAVTIAADDPELARDLAETLGTATFRLYHSDDMRGVEIGGSAKNVLAIACGIATGCGLGASANAALIARGFAELRRFGAAYGARSETLMGLSGLGDLVLTCSSEQSRNFAFGVALGRGTSVGQASGGKLAEGAFTASVLVEMARKKGIEAPICEAVDSLLAGRIDVPGAIDSLLSRPQRGE